MEKAACPVGRNTSIMMFAAVSVRICQRTTWYMGCGWVGMCERELKPLGGEREREAERLVSCCKCPNLRAQPTLAVTVSQRLMGSHRNPQSVANVSALSA